MAVNRDLWTGTLTQTWTPAWPCPTCSKGHLKLSPGSLNFAETKESQNHHHNEDFSLHDVSYVFSALLKCTHCKENIACSGTGWVTEEQYWDENGEAIQEVTDTFRPKFFSKPMPLFTVPQRCPKPLKEALKSSFYLFFTDEGAAANHARQCVEELLTDADIAGKTAGGNFINLGKRITAFAEKDEKNATRLDALRWLGNHASHSDEVKLNRNDLFDIYDILDVVIEDRYVGAQRRVDERVAQINARKGPIR